jgi:putative transposase
LTTKKKRIRLDDMLRTHKIALAPNNRQRTYFAKASGCARAAYNWALAEWNRQYEAHRLDGSLPKPNRYDINKKFNAIKKAEFPWMDEVTSRAPMIAIQQLDKAFRNFFGKRARRPKFRKKGANDRFSLTNDSTAIEGNKITIPKLGKVRMKQPLRFDGRIIAMTISRTADTWHASVTVETPDTTPIQDKNQGPVGVDLGITALATLSTGEKIQGPKPLKNKLRHLRRLSRSVSRKVKGSKNRDKAKRRLARLHAKLSDIRNDALHKLTTSLTKRFREIVIEDLDVAGMLKNKKLSRQISDMGFGEFKRQLQYKTIQSGKRLTLANRYYPSTKTCSACGHALDELPLSQRSWTCPNCAASHDRDANAAINLMKQAAGVAASACGGAGSGDGRKTAVKPGLMKQEATDAKKHASVAKRLSA